MALNRAGQLRPSRQLLTFLGQHGYESTDKLIIVVGPSLVIDLRKRRQVRASQLTLSVRAAGPWERTEDGQERVTHLELLPFLHLLLETGLVVCNLGLYTLQQR